MQRPVIVESPASWNLLNWIVRPLEFLDACSRRYGDCFAVQFSQLPPLVFLSNPQAIEQIFTANPRLFDSGRANWILRRTLGDQSLLMLDGDRHQRQRQLLMPPFHGERMRAYGDLIQQVTKTVTEDWQPGTSLTIRPCMQEISMQVILQAVFGLVEGERFQQLKHSLKSMLDLTTTRFGFATAFFPILQRDFGAWSPGGKLQRLLQQIDQLLYAEIHERRSVPDDSRSDILSLLLAARDETGQPMTDEELRDELMTLLVAGHETTATALTWALYWLHQLPDIKAKLLAELNTLSDTADAMTIARLPYLNAVCCETLRIYPVVFISQLRIAKAPVEVTGYHFDEGAMLVPCIYLTHHRPDLYPHPDRFNPDRFLEQQFSPYEFYAFGGSNRRCIGAAFASFEMKLVLATLLSHYSLQLTESRPVRPRRRGVTSAPNSNIHMVVIDRQPAAAYEPPPMLQAK